MGKGISADVLEEAGEANGLKKFLFGGIKNGGRGKGVGEGGWFELEVWRIEILEF